MRILFFTTFFLLASTAVVFSQGTTRTIKIEIFPSGYEIVEISTEPGPDVFLEIPKVGKTISKNGYSCDLDSVGAVIRYGKLINNTKKDGIWTEVRWYGSQTVSYTHLTLPTKRIV